MAEGKSTVEGGSEGSGSAGDSTQPLVRPDAASTGATPASSPVASPAPSPAQNQNQAASPPQTPDASGAGVAGETIRIGEAEAPFGVDVIYAADDRAVASGGGIQRWTLSGATFVLDGTIKKGLTAGARGLTGFVSAGKVTLLATTAESPPRVVRFTDDGTALDMLPAQPLATAAANTAYRGIALVPQ